jgi:thiol-disulfide isomerase/thioredoxin
MYETVCFLSDLKDKNIVCLDIFNFKGLIKRLRVMEIPTVILMENGKEKKRISGKVSRASLQDICIGEEISKNG